MLLRPQARWGATLRRAVFFLLMFAAATAAGQTRSDPARGAEKAILCAACHGPEGRAPVAGTPALAAQQREFLETQMVFLREGLRDVPAMAGMLKGLTDRDLMDIAAYYNTAQPFAEKGPRDAQRYATGASLAKALGCDGCHRRDFSGQRGIPRIVNQREDYLAATLKAYRDEKRTASDTNMNAVMYGTTDADIAALAHFLAQQ